MTACRFAELTHLPLTRRRPLWCSTCGAVVPDGLEALNAHLVAAVSGDDAGAIRVGTRVTWVDELDRLCAYGGVVLEVGAAGGLGVQWGSHYLWHHKDRPDRVLASYDVIQETP